MAKADIWMPLFIGDYLADTMQLTTEQHGAYLLMIMAYWRNGGPLPDDDALLATICRMTPDAWSNAKAMLKQFFSNCEAGVLRHARIDAELAEAIENSAKKRARAIKGAEARWGNAQGNAQAMLKQCPSPSPSPSPPSGKEHGGEQSPQDSSKPLKAKDLVAEGVDKKHAEDWLAVRKLKRLPLTTTAWSQTKAEGEKVGMNPGQVVAKCAQESWAGFKAQWIINEQSNSAGRGAPLNKQQQVEENNRRVVEEMAAGVNQAPGLDLGGAVTIDGEVIRVE